MKAVMVGALLAVASCTYNPPPQVSMLGPASRLFAMGEPIVLQFSEPVSPESLEIRIWPGQKALYDVEGDRLPGVDPLLSDCTVADSPCGAQKEVALTLSADRTQATLMVDGKATALVGQPLVLELSGELADDSGHQRRATVFFDFQIVQEIVVPDDDLSGIDGLPADALPEPLGVVDGFFLKHSDFTFPLKLSQQFFCDMKVNQQTGQFVMVLVDADPKEGMPGNTANPEELYMDTGAEAFIFVIHGKVWRDEQQGLLFKGEPVDLIQTIGSIHMELHGMVTAGRITQEGETASWDGTIAVDYLEYGTVDKTFRYSGEECGQTNFQMVLLKPAEVPAGMPTVCETAEEVCSVVGGRCDLLPDWPPPAVCAAAE